MALRGQREKLSTADEGANIENFLALLKLLAEYFSLQTIYSMLKKIQGPSLICLQTFKLNSSTYLPVLLEISSSPVSKEVSILVSYLVDS